MTSEQLPDDVTAAAGELGGVPVVTVGTSASDPSTSDPSAVLFYLHGGAYAIGSAPDSVGLASDVARRVGARAISVDYRLAPEHRFPAAASEGSARLPILRRAPRRGGRRACCRR
ncbi:acetyl esterase/lipase [Catenulispora sp. EB89]|uniref:alpha/beta hydrolase fold domain-containing protein n=1 Tax=Catenulispora sp. EB89 TaxID=3156257 RepID=UPI003511C8EA